MVTARTEKMRPDILQFLQERGDVTAVVIKPCMSFKDKTMYVKVCAALVVIQIYAGVAPRCQQRATDGHL